ncbi:MAG: hypothetical protein WDN69_36270 [Aliidongia sp.]
MARACQAKPGILVQPQNRERIPSSGLAGRRQADRARAAHEQRAPSLVSNRRIWALTVDWVEFNAAQPW